MTPYEFVKQQVSEDLGRDEKSYVRLAMDTDVNGIYDSRKKTDNDCYFASWKKLW